MRAVSLLILAASGVFAIGCATARATDPSLGSMHVSGGDTAAERTAIYRVIDRLFEGMATRDTALLRTVLFPGSVIMSQRVDDPAGPIRRVTDSGFIASMASGTTKLLERWWNPTLLLRHGVATVWTPYDFHIDGKFSHCGIDSFTLVRTADGWRIAGIFYTTERTGCPQSPLGPPKP